MIKTGISIYDGITPELIRLLIRHPDVEISWLVDRGEPVSVLFDNMLGMDNLPVVDMREGNPDLSGIDLYIGHDSAWLREGIEAYPEMKVIFTGGAPGYEGLIAGVCEYNRKALVRGGCLAMQPDVPTLLGAIGLMPLAKNLMLNSPISGTMIVPHPYEKYESKSPYDRADFKIYPSGTDETGARSNGFGFETLRKDILEELQSSFNTSLEINVIQTGASDFACAILTVDVKMRAEQAKEMYQEFYGDHRHIFFPENMQITDRMVRGTNNTAIVLSNDGQGRLVVTVGFDSRYKAGAGNILHLLNLLFGLDERTGF